MYEPVPDWVVVKARASLMEAMIADWEDIRSESVRASMIVLRNDIEEEGLSLRVRASARGAK